MAVTAKQAQQQYAASTWYLNIFRNDKPPSTVPSGWRAQNPDGGMRRQTNCALCDHGARLLGGGAGESYM